VAATCGSFVKLGVRVWEEAGVRGLGFVPLLGVPAWGAISRREGARAGAMKKRKQEAAAVAATKRPA